MASGAGCVLCSSIGAVVGECGACVGECGACVGE